MATKKKSPSRPVRDPDAEFYEPWTLRVGLHPWGLLQVDPDRDKGIADCALRFQLPYNAANYQPRPADRDPRGPEDNPILGLVVELLEAAATDLGDVEQGFDRPFGAERSFRHLEAIAAARREAAGIHEGGPARRRTSKRARSRRRAP